jgi:hypothetical protein
VTPEQLIAKALEQRERWVDLEADGRKVRVRRPPEAQMFRFRGGTVTEDDFLRCAVGWEGFTEAHILPLGVGGDSVVPFNSALWLTLASDNMAWIGKVAESVVAAVTEHLSREEAAAKN